MVGYLGKRRRRTWCFSVERTVSLRHQYGSVGSRIGLFSDTAVPSYIFIKVPVVVMRPSRKMILVAPSYSWIVVWWPLVGGINGVGIIASLRSDPGTALSVLTANIFSGK